MVGDFTLCEDVDEAALVVSANDIELHLRQVITHRRDDGLARHSADPYPILFPENGTTSSFRPNASATGAASAAAAARTGSAAAFVWA